jgi:hypothetical protein
MHKHLNNKHTEDYLISGGGQTRRRVARMLGAVKRRRRKVERPRWG